MSCRGRAVGSCAKTCCTHTPAVRVRARNSRRGVFKVWAVLVPRTQSSEIRSSDSGDSPAFSRVNSPPVRGGSSVGRAPALQAGCREFESPPLHFVREVSARNRTAVTSKPLASSLFSKSYSTLPPRSWATRFQRAPIFFIAADPLPVQPRGKSKTNRTSTIIRADRSGKRIRLRPLRIVVLGNRFSILVESLHLTRLNQLHQRLSDRRFRCRAGRDHDLIHADRLA